MLMEKSNNHSEISMLEALNISEEFMPIGLGTRIGHSTHRKHGKECQETKGIVKRLSIYTAEVLEE